MRIANSKCQTIVIHAGHMRKCKWQNNEPVVDIGETKSRVRPKLATILHLGSSNAYILHPGVDNGQRQIQYSGEYSCFRKLSV